ncbi:MAG: zinc-ribbon domain-containing protein [Thermoguttaceae bacterium]|nr:zinc-ribbon domain-containing protein [Thermoguttaceae bacterium]
MSYCPQCGAQTPEGAAFCGVCGTQLSAPSCDATLDQESNPYAVGAQADMSVDQYQGGEPKPTFGETLKRCFGKKYADFSGRASRREYWFFIVWNVILLIVLAMTVAVGAMLVVSTLGDAEMARPIGVVIGLLFGLYLVIPNCSVVTRRFHDIGLPTWSAVVVLMINYASNAIETFPKLFSSLETTVPVWLDWAGTIVALLIFVVALIPGSKKPNNYGLPPANRQRRYY